MDGPRIAAEFQPEVAPAGQRQRRAEQRHQRAEGQAALRRTPFRRVDARMPQQGRARQPEALDDVQQAPAIGHGDTDFHLRGDFGTGHVVAK